MSVNEYLRWINLKYLIVVFIWAGYGVIHSALIGSRLTDWLRRVMGTYFAFYRLGYNLFSLVLFFVLFYFTKNVDSELVIKFVPPWTILQQGLLVASGVTIIWALLSYDVLEFVGIRQVINFGQSKAFGHPKIITKKGLLGIVRHPMYLATIVFMWSLNSTKVDILVHLILTMYILIGIRLEERKLVKEFGSAYTQYQADVPALVPSVQKWRH